MNLLGRHVIIGEGHGVQNGVLLLHADVGQALVADDGADLGIQAVHIAVLYHVVMERVHVLLAAVRDGGLQQALELGVLGEALGAQLIWLWV